MPKKSDKTATVKTEKTTTMVGTAYNIIKGPQYKNFFLGVLILSLIIFSFLYGFWLIPFLSIGIHRMSAIGFVDYLYVIIVSFLVAVLITLGKYEKSIRLAGESKYLSKGSTIFAAILATACPVC